MVNLRTGFLSNTNEKIAFTIPRADAGLTASQAENLMENMIASGIILTDKGRPAKIDFANLVTTTTVKRV